MAKLNKTSVILIVVILLIIAAVYFMVFGNNGENSSSAGQNPAQSVKTQSGLLMQDEVVGTGAMAAAGKTVTVNYTGTFTNGTAFDSNVDPKFGHVQPFSFVLGAGRVIPGWDEGVAGMKVGGKRKLTIPPELGYGSRDNGPIPGNSTLVFEVELLDVKLAN